MKLLPGIELRDYSLGEPMRLTEVPPMISGATWSEDGWITVAPSFNESLARVSADGRALDKFIDLNGTQGEKGQVWPQALPGNNAVIYTARMGPDPLDTEDSAVIIEHLATGKRREVVRPAQFGRYVESGHLVFLRGRSLMAAPFDQERGEVTADTVEIADDVHVNSEDRVPQFALSSKGLLIYAGSDLEELPPASTVVWRDGNGGRERVSLPEGASYAFPRLDPSGERLSVTVTRGNTIDVWVHEFDRGVMTLVTPDPGRDFHSVWSPDGKWLAYSRFSQEGLTQLYKLPTDASLPAEPIRVSSSVDFPTSWTSEGSVLAIVVVQTKVQTLGHNMDIWTMNVGDPESGRPWLATPFNEVDGYFSPDGKWIAYVSDESGSEEVYVRPYPGPGARTKVSVSGGWGPAWSADQKTLYYSEKQGIMAVPVDGAGGFSTGPARLVLEGPFPLLGAPPRRNYDVSSDGRIITVEDSARAPANTRLRVVSGWAPRDGP